jgi:hypothetical protein
MTLSIMTLSIMTLSIMTLSIMTLSIITLETFMLSVVYAECHFIVSVANKPIMISVIMLSVVMLNVEAPESDSMMGAAPLQFSFYSVLCLYFLNLLTLGALMVALPLLA